MRLASLARAAMLALVGVIAASATAHAYPQFQLATGTDRCIACHYSPAGGGLINDYGRDEAGSTISRGGDGRFLHGAWTPPTWLQLGLDLRGAALVKVREPETEVLGFPMQTDLYLRAGGERFSINVTAGLRGGARDPQPPLGERVVSREHYVMYARESGTYVRAGRFFPIFGIRSQDHTAAVRRYLGFHTLEEPYGAAAGTFGDTWEAHVSAFVPRPVDFLGAGVHASGAAAYYEQRFLDDTAALGAQARVAVSPTDARVTAGIVGKRYLEGAGVMLLAEVDLQRQAFRDGGGPTRYQLASYLAASRFVTRGVMVGAALHRWQPDLRLRSSRDAFEVNIQYFPRAHFELHLLTRVGGQGDFDDPGLLSLLQLHYYL
ncbi:MAG: hypothetical protein M3680_06775 [Myxococcota bacterium]|nr:hypothetical protein [Myxococcota bacterium]